MFHTYSYKCGHITSPESVFRPFYLVINRVSINRATLRWGFSKTTWDRTLVDLDLPECLQTYKEDGFDLRFMGRKWSKGSKILTDYFAERAAGLVLRRMLHKELLGRSWVTGFYHCSFCALLDVHSTTKKSSPPKKSGDFGKMFYPLPAATLLVSLM